MKSNIHINQSKLSVLVTTVLLISSCAKVNYDDRKTAPTARSQEEQSAPVTTFNLLEKQSFQMTEGEIKEVQFDLGSPVQKDTQIVWSILKTDKTQNVDLQSRFKQSEGHYLVKTGEQIAILQIPSQDVDEIKQGNQNFQIQLKAVLTNEESLADLLLIDATKTNDEEEIAESQLAFDESTLQLKSNSAGEVYLILNTASKSDVRFHLQSEDDTAKASQDYVAINEDLIIKKGDAFAKVQIMSLKAACKDQKTLKLQVTELTGAKMITETALVTLPVDLKKDCLEKESSTTKD